MSWECPECGEVNSDDSIAICVCGYNRNEIFEEPYTQLVEDTESKQAVPGHPRRVLWEIFEFVFVVHFVAWSVVMVKQTVGRPYMLARFFMTNAVVLTGFYIHPLEKMIGPKNSLLKPLTGIRDVLFDIAWDLFPEDDGDRSFYWYPVYGNNEIMLDTIHSYNVGKENDVFTDVEYREYFSQINAHLADLALLPMKDKKNRSKRYFYFGGAAKRYKDSYGIYLAQKHRVNYYVVPGSEYMKNIRTQFQLFFQVRKLSKKEAPRTYEAFETRTDDWWYPIERCVLGMANNIIRADMLLGQFNCSNDEVLEFLESRQKILLYGPIDKSAENRKHAKTFIANAIYNPSYTYGSGTTYKLLKDKCNDTTIQSYEKYPPTIMGKANVSN